MISSDALLAEWKTKKVKELQKTTSQPRGGEKPFFKPPLSLSLPHSLSLSLSKDDGQVFCKEERA